MSYFLWAIFRGLFGLSVTITDKKTCRNRLSLVISRNS